MNDDDDSPILIRDNYGFLIDDFQSADGTFIPPQQPKPPDYKVIEKRDIAWHRFLNSLTMRKPGKPNDVSNLKGTESKALFSLILRGVPVAFRGAIWSSLLESSNSSSDIIVDFDDCLSRANAELSKTTSSDIYKDLDRTYPGHEFFDDKKGMDQLKDVLQAFAVNNPDIGYCQSLNFIAGMLLLFFNKGSSFSILNRITNDILPENYFTSTMEGAYIDQLVLQHITRSILPGVYGAFSRYQLDLGTICQRWFITMFVSLLPSESCLRVWDVIFYHQSSEFLFRVAMAMFKIFEIEINRCTSFGELFKLVSRLPKRCDDPDLLIQTAQSLSYKRGIASFFGLAKNEITIEGEVQRLRIHYHQKVTESTLVRKQTRAYSDEALSDDENIGEEVESR